MKTNHTPGPWLTCKHGTPGYAPQYGIYAEGDPRDLAIIQGDNAQADAVLIASAPDMLASLRAVLDYTPHPNVHRGAILADYKAIVSAAIRKATEPA